MSQVNVVIVHKQKIYTASLHYSELVKLLERGVVKDLPSLPVMKYLDAGYLVIDLNKNLVLSSQDAIDVNKYVKKKEVWRL